MELELKLNNLHEDEFDELLDGDAQSDSDDFREPYDIAVVIDLIKSQSPYIYDVQVYRDMVGNDYYTRFECDGPAVAEDLSNWFKLTFGDELRFECIEDKEHYEVEFRAETLSPSERLLEWFSGENRHEFFKNRYIRLSPGKMYKVVIIYAEGKALRV